MRPLFATFALLARSLAGPCAEPPYPGSSVLIGGGEGGADGAFLPARKFALGADAASRCSGFGLAAGEAGGPVEVAQCEQQLLAAGTSSGAAYGSSPASVAAQHSLPLIFLFTTFALACPLASSVTISRKAPVQLPLFLFLLLVQRGASRSCGIGQYFDSAHGICEDCPAGYECGLSASDNAGTLCSPERALFLHFPTSIICSPLLSLLPPPILQNTYSSSGAGVCCPLGSWSAKHSDVCNICPIGNYCTGGVATPCYPATACLKPGLSAQPPCSWSVDTLAGNTSTTWIDGLGALASFSYPNAVAVWNSSLFVGDTGNNRIRRVNLTSRMVTTFAGSGADSMVDALGTAAAFSQPSGLIVVGEILYISDSGNNRIRSATFSGLVRTVAGSSGGLRDGSGTNAFFI